MKHQKERGRRRNVSRARKKRPSSRHTGKPRSIPLAHLSARSYAARERAIHVLAAMRADSKLSLSHAARLQGVKPETVKRYFPSSLKKVKGKVRATKSDRYRHKVYLPDDRGNPIEVNGSWRQRQDAGRYLGDLGRYYRGARGALSTWHGKNIAGVELLTDERTLVAIEPALSDFSLYRAFNS